MLARRSGTIATPLVRKVAELLGMKGEDSLASIPDMVDSANQSGRAAPFAVADLITAISAIRPDAEVTAFGFGEVVLAHKLNWPKPVPLLLPERLGSAFRTIGGRGRVRPGEPDYPKAICLALVDGVDTALRSAAEIDHRAARLLAVMPKVRTKGAEPVIRTLLNEDAVAASAPGSTYHAGRQTDCSTASRVSRWCESSPAGPHSGSLGCDDGRSERNQNQSATGERATTGRPV